MALDSWTWCSGSDSALSGKRLQQCGRLSWAHYSYGDSEHQISGCRGFDGQADDCAKIRLLQTLLPNATSWDVTGRPRVKGAVFKLSSCRHADRCFLDSNYLCCEKGARAKGHHSARQG